MSRDSERRERDLILAPNEYAYLLDETKGNVINYVGPHKTSLANTDQPVIFNSKSKKFERCNLDTAIQSNAIAPEGWYVVLKNPARNPEDQYPKRAVANSLAKLDVGRKVNIPGPISFSPWPGQMVRVIKGHHLRSNQYLIVRVYDDEGAKANWGQAVIKPQTSGGDSAENPTPTTTPLPDLTMGKLLVIKGTDVSFYIPPTGIEVVREGGQLIRDAATLERLEYCILLDENGNKRYVIGPSVVFPEPTETFVVHGNSLKYRAIELSEIRGIYVKVIAPYVDGDKQYTVGEELFITGKDQMIYYPRPEHAIIRYEGNEMHYAVAIPMGEARYVMNRLTGAIRLEKGPSMMLLDPREEVVIQRLLSDNQTNLWFPGNAEALAHNQKLRALHDAEQGAGATEQAVMMTRRRSAKVQRLTGVDAFNRGSTYTPPRTITLDTKFEGAVTINVWTGYAVQVVSKSDQRKVIVGPATYFLEYDETLDLLSFSTGRPKSDKAAVRSVYLRVLNNKVSDVVAAETADFIPVSVELSYQINFEGDPEKWFNVENYIKLLTDHLRSELKHAIRQHGIEDFYANAIPIVRDTVLGEPDAEGQREGHVFKENGMRIHDVEIVHVSIEDEYVSGLLMEAQHAQVQQSLALSTERNQLQALQEQEQIRQAIAQSEAETKQLLLDLQLAEASKKLALNLAKINAEVEAEQSRLQAKLAEQSALDEINDATLARQKADADIALEISERRLQQRLDELKAEVQAVVDKSGSVSPQLVAALQAFGDKALAERMAESMAPLAILGGESVAEVFGRLLQGTALETVLKSASASASHPGRVSGT